MKKKNIFLFGAVVLLLAILSPTVLSSTFKIDSFFKDREQKVASVDPSIIVVTGNDFQITGQEYVDYQENLTMIAELNNISKRLSANEIIEQMIEQKILVQHANNLGINVSEKEIVAYAEQTKEAAEQNESPELKEIQEALAKKYDVSPEEYFFHPDVLKEYEKLLKINKLFDELVPEKAMADEDAIQKFIETIKQQYKDTYKIDVTQLNKL